MSQFDKSLLAVCRVCGGDESLKFIEDFGEFFIEKLKLCTDITVLKNDLLPKQICDKCVQNVEISYQLRRQGEMTQIRLKMQLEKNSQDMNDSSIVCINTNNDVNKNTEKLVEVLKLKEYEVAEVDTFIEENVADMYENIDDDIYIEYIEEDDEGLTTDENLLVAIDSRKDDNVNDIEEIKEESEELIDKAATTTLALQKKSKLYTCATCQQTFTALNEYNIHIKEHGTEKFCCAECGKCFAKKSILVRHETLHKRKQEVYPCPDCGRLYNIAYNLTRHIRSVHEKIRKYVCNVCAEKFSRADVLKTHMLTHLKERNFLCTVCNASFKSLRYLNSHMRLHQPLEGKNATGAVRNPLKANISIDDTNNNSETTKRVIQDNKRVFQCGVCGKISKHHFTHKNHLRVHTKERPHNCDICNKKFRTNAALKTHLRIHTGERPFQCDICYARFRQKPHLQEHHLKHEGILPHACDMCDARFIKKSNLRCHQQIHSMDKQFKCSMCPKEFPKTLLLKQHMLKDHIDTKSKKKIKTYKPNKVKSKKKEELMYMIADEEEQYDLEEMIESEQIVQIDENNIINEAEWNDETLNALNFDAQNENSLDLNDYDLVEEEIKQEVEELIVEDGEMDTNLQNNLSAVIIEDNATVDIINDEEGIVWITDVENSTIDEEKLKKYYVIEEISNY